MSKSAQNQDEAVEKIRREDLDDNKNDYNINKTISDSDLSDAEEEEPTSST